MEKEAQNTLELCPSWELDGDRFIPEAVRQCFRAQQKNHIYGCIHRCIHSLCVCVCVNVRMKIKANKSIKGPHLGSGKQLAQVCVCVKANK